MLTRTRNSQALLAAALVVGLSGCTPQQREARFLKRGQEFMARKDYPRAYLEFKNAAALRPQDADPYRQMGLAALAAGDTLNGARALKRATELNPKLPDAQLEIAKILTDSGDTSLTQEAVQRLGQVLEALPDNPEALDALAIAQYRLGKPDDALKSLQIALKNSPTHLRSSIRLAQLKLLSGDAAAAEEALRKAVTGAPESVDVAVALAQFYLAQQKFDPAETQARRVLRLDPKNIPALLVLASTQTESHRLPEAEQTYKEISELPDPRYRTVHAVFLFQEGRRDAALAELQQLTRNYPDDRAPRTRLVALLAMMNRLQDAERELDAALTRNGRDLDTLWQRGQLDLATGKIRQAEHDFSQLVGQRPDFADVHYAIATVVRLEKQPLRQRQELAEALRLNPGLLPARVSLARSFVAAGDGKAALHVLDEAPKQQQNVLAFLIERNWALLQTGNAAAARPTIQVILKATRLPDVVLQDAIVNLVANNYAAAAADAKEVLRTDPTNARAASLLADTLLAQKQLPKAVEEVRQLVSQHSDSAPLQVLLGRLLASRGDFVQARVAFEAAKKAAPQAAEVDLALAELSYWEKRPLDARLNLQTAIANDASDIRALLALGDLTAPTDRKRAIELYRSAVALDPSNFVALNNLAYWLAKSSPDEALPFAQKAVELAPGNPDVQDTLGWIFYRKGLYRAAIPHLQEAVKTSPTPVSQFHLGMAYMKNGENTTGQSLLASALQKEPGLAKTGLE